MRRSLFLVSALLLLVAGCQRLNYHETFELKFAHDKAIDFQGPTYKQTLEVTITPKDSPVSAWIIKPEDKDKVERDLNRGKEPSDDLVLGGKSVKGDKPETIEFTAEIPAKTAFTLFIKGPKRSTSVEVSVKGR